VPVDEVELFQGEKNCSFYLRLSAKSAGNITKRTGLS